MVKSSAGEEKGWFSDLLKRGTDIVLGAVGCTLLAPAMVFVGILVCLRLGTPILYRQTRLGLRGRSIQVLKFRSMTEQRDIEGKLLPDEERTTHLGRFVRRSRLDELPTFWLVITGDMSLVGPRPLPLSSYSDGTSYNWRLSVRPGFTGLAQVSGNTKLSATEKFAVDAYYIRHRGWICDLWILARTLQVVVCGERRAGRVIDRALAEWEQMA